MAVTTFRQALNDAMFEEMRRDDSVIILGEDVSGGAGGTSGERDASGGIFGVSKGLIFEFGENRVIDTPISESAIIGAGAGAALAGLRPISEIMFADFVGVCMDQIYNQAAKFRYMFGGEMPAGHPHGDGCGNEHGRAALADDLPDPDRRAGPEDRGPVERCRCQGSFEDSNS